MRDRIKSNADATDCLGRMQEHLAANNVDLATIYAMVGITQ